MVKILLDTNFLVYCANQKIDYLREISKMINGEKELIALSSMVSELENLVKKTRKLKDRASAELALKILNNYIKKEKIKVLKTNKTPDSAIIGLAKTEKNIIVATADRGLKKEVRGKARILSIRGKKHLELT